jgi:hypothetical protein
MEKLRFTIRFIAILVAFPVIMYTELTRDEKGTNEQKQTKTEQVSVKTGDADMLSYTSFAMQVVYK